MTLRPPQQRQGWPLEEENHVTDSLVGISCENFDRGQEHVASRFVEPCQDPVDGQKAQVHQDIRDLGVQRDSHVIRDRVQEGRGEDVPQLGKARELLLAEMVRGAVLPAQEVVAQARRRVQGEDREEAPDDDPNLRRRRVSRHHGGCNIAPEAFQVDDQFFLRLAGEIGVEGPAFLNEVKRIRKVPKSIMEMQIRTLTTRIQSRISQLNWKQKRAVGTV